jgi:hypothetical protein
MPHREKEVSFTVAGKAAAEEKGASMLGESQKVFYYLVHCHVEGSFFKKQVFGTLHLETG